jgi:kynurenine formamidase
VSDEELTGDGWWPSRHGADDQTGAGNELTAERTLRALRLPREGRVVELGHILGADAAGATASRIFHQVVLAHGALERLLPGAPGRRESYLEEAVTQTYHMGTHVDGLGHLGIEGRFYNGVHYEEFFDASGLTRLGVENLRPWVCRGVLLDIASLEGTERLSGGFAITDAHLERACARDGVEIDAGDAVLLHTGWGGLWTSDQGAYNTEEPGLGIAGARWLTDRRVSVVGADNWALEVIPHEDEQAPFVVHQHLLAETGTYILENLRTEELRETGASEFLFVMSPPKTRGSTGAMAAPLAVI